jgi:hypothetical protein
MELRMWRTSDAEDSAFAAEWDTLGVATGQFNFTMDRRYLDWESAHGRHAQLLLARDGERRGGIVLRVERSGLASGWPWRWQFAVTDGARRPDVVPSRDQCAWIVQALAELRSALTIHLPHPLTGIGGGSLAGRTILAPIADSDAAQLALMDTNKRRHVKTSTKQGFVITRGTDLASFRDYERLQRETEQRRVRGSGFEARATVTVVPEPESLLPAPGESFREWEHPWMLLLLATRDGVAEATSGFGFVPGGAMDYRANASTEAGRKAGANAHLAFAAMQLAREYGCRIMNWGGATPFKRELGGRLQPIYVWRGGTLAARAAGVARLARTRLEETARSGIARIRQGTTKGVSAPSKVP